MSDSFQSKQKNSNNKSRKVTQIVNKLQEEGVPLWAISEIVHQKIINMDDYNSTERKVFLKKYAEVDESDLSDNHQSNTIDIVMRLNRKGVPFWAMSDILDVPMRYLIYISRIWDSQETGKPWEETRTLQNLFIQKQDMFLKQQRYFTEISDIFGCHQETVRTAVDKLGISQVGGKNRPSSRNVWFFKSINIPNSDDLIDGSLTFDEIIDQENV